MLIKEKQEALNARTGYLVGAIPLANTPKKAITHRYLSTVLRK
jgi:hypothetical protein